MSVCHHTPPKIPRPDGKPDFLGLKVLDEPAAVQSDAGVLALRLRQLGRVAPGAAAEVVGCVDTAGGPRQRAKAIDAWIGSVGGAAVEWALLATPL
jgi:intraflagellar transport protein 46